VDLELKTCSCAQWQIFGKPCTHAVCFIFSLRQVNLEDYVHEYNSLERFKAAYQFEVNPMVDKSQWRDKSTRWLTSHSVMTMILGLRCCLQS
jgi:hypothetical protein